MTNTSPLCHFLPLFFATPLPWPFFQWLAFLLSPCVSKKVTSMMLLNVVLVHFCQVKFSNTFKKYFKKMLSPNISKKVTSMLLNVVLVHFCQVKFSNTFKKYFQKILSPNISYPLTSTHTCAYQGIRNVSFSENFAYVLNEWSLYCQPILSHCSLFMPLNNIRKPLIFWYFSEGIKQNIGLKLVQDTHCWICASISTILITIRIKLIHTLHAKWSNTTYYFSTHGIATGGFVGPASFDFVFAFFALKKSLIVRFVRI